MFEQDVKFLNGTNVVDHRDKEAGILREAYRARMDLSQ